MLICEDMLLLLTRDDGRTEAWVSYRDYALAAGLLADLALADCVEFEDRKNPKVWLAGEVGGGAGQARSEARSTFPAPGAAPGAAEDAGPGAVMEFGIRALAERSKPPRVQSLVTAGWFNPREVVSRTHETVTVHPADAASIRPAEWEAYADHRIATSGAVLGLAFELAVDDIEATSKTIPEFAELWTSMAGTGVA